MCSLGKKAIDLYMEEEVQNTLTYDVEFLVNLSEDNMKR